MEIEVSYGLSIKVEDKTEIANIKSEKPDRETATKATLAQRNMIKLPCLELAKHKYNIQMILQCSNATPIRTHYVGSGYICCFCKAHYLRAADLKNHTIEEHDDATKNRFMQSTGLVDFAVKLDITSLICNICRKPSDNLEHLIDHLNNIHQRGLHTDIKSHIACFKLDGDAMKCHICKTEFNSFKFLQGHMSKHFSNFICDVCGVGFINRRQLATHSDTHRTGTHKCSACDKVFQSLRKLKSHERQAHLSTTELYKCFSCGEKFKNRNTKKIHMIKHHGVEFADFKCNACDKTFKSTKSLYYHKKRDHLMIRYTCAVCDRMFCRADKLKLHEMTHTGAVRKFKCDLCSKCYTRKCTLKEHIRTHSDRVRQAGEGRRR